MSHLLRALLPKKALVRHFHDGDIDEKKKDPFYQAVRDFYQRAALEAYSKLPLQDAYDALIHARFVNFFQRENVSFEDVEFLVKKYSTVLPTDARDTHLLQEEFVMYQVLSNEDISKKVWDEVEIKLASEENDEKSSFNFRMEVIWGYLSSLKIRNGSHKFGRISNVAKTVLSLPHSNGSEEIFFLL